MVKFARSNTVDARRSVIDILVATGTLVCQVVVFMQLPILAMLSGQELHAAISRCLVYGLARYESSVIRFP